MALETRTDLLIVHTVLVYVSRGSEVKMCVHSPHHILYVHCNSSCLKHIYFVSTSFLLTDVFVKVIFVQGQKQASKKWQSSGGSSAPSPVFNQKFQFQLPAPLTHLESEQDYLNIILLCRSGKHGYWVGLWALTYCGLLPTVGSYLLWALTYCGLLPTVRVAC